QTTYTFLNVHANHTISATFSQIQYTITATAGAGGSIAPPTGSVACGTDQKYDITANDCFVIEDVKVDGVSIGAQTTYTFLNVRADHTISATFRPITYTITATAGAGGSIGPPTGSVGCGTDQKYDITPNDCFVIEDVKVDGVSIGAQTTYTFLNVHANH